jgi:hypothetical protein
MKLKEFIESRSHLFWYSKDLSEVSEDFVLEQVLNFGDWEDVTKLFDIIGIEKAQDIFADNFNEKIFKFQLAYFDDIDYSEKVFYSPGFVVDDEIIKKQLSDLAVQ